MSDARSTPRGYITELDGLRGIAILLVMVHRMYPRAGGASPWPVEAGWIGVDLFFVISGYLITGILLDTRDDRNFFRNFYARRVLRIFPLFYVLVGGLFLVFPLAGHTQFVREAGSPLWYLLHLGNVPEALLGKDPPYWIATVWSLAIEEQFYWTFPLLVRFAKREHLARWLAVAAGVAVATRVVTLILIPERERVQYLFTLCRLDTIAAGCMLAVLVRTAWFVRSRARLARPLVAIAAACGGVELVAHFDRTTIFGRTAGYSVVALGFAAVVLLVVLARGTRRTAWLRSPVLAYPGKLCFGLYLLHRPADTLVGGLAARLHLAPESFAWLPVKIAAALALATISWRVLEQPFLRLKALFASSRHPIEERARAVAPASGQLAYNAGASQG
jgi:peptidoglycan/LPS O-acetylase OafA/YrhL